MKRGSELLSVVPVFPADARNQLRALTEAGLSTDLVGLGCIHRRSWLAKLIRICDPILRLNSEVLLRSYWIDEVERHSVHTMIWPVVRNRIRRKLAISEPSSIASDRMSKVLDLKAKGMVTQSTKVVLGRENASSRTFEKAKATGAICLLDLPAPHISTVQKLMAIETQEFPDASNEIHEEHEYAPERVARKTSELELADCILVASQMTERSVVQAGIDPAKIVRIPYGCVPPTQTKTQFSNRKPVVLFVGGCSMRKGVPRLLRVWKRLKAHHHFTLRLIGNMVLTEKFLEQYRGLYEHIPTIANSMLLQHYSTSYCLAFPAVADGFGLVVNEALASGLPIVASSNNGAPGFVEHNRQGLIYEHGDDEQLASHLDWMMTNPVRVEEMSDESLQLAESWTWSQYREAYAKLVSGLIEKAKLQN